MDQLSSTHQKHWYSHYQVGLLTQDYSGKNFLLRPPRWGLSIGNVSYKALFFFKSIFNNSGNNTAYTIALTTAMLQTSIHRLVLGLLAQGQTTLRQMFMLRFNFCQLDCHWWFWKKKLLRESSNFKVSVWLSATQNGQVAAQSFSTLQESKP